MANKIKWKRFFTLSVVKDGNLEILEIAVFPYFCKELLVILHTLLTSSSTFNLNIKCSLNSLLASFRRLNTFWESLLLDNVIVFNRKEVHYDWVENNVKSVTCRAAIFVQYRCNLAHSEHFSSKLGIYTG